jgi:hypothetical protein
MENPENYRIQFIEHFKKEGHIEYRIRIVWVDTSARFIDFTERYKNLEKIHKTFKKEAKESNLQNFPKFPGKTLFGQNKNEKFLSKRQELLQVYFSNLQANFSKKLINLKRWVGDMIAKKEIKEFETARRETLKNFPITPIKKGEGNHFFSDVRHTLNKTTGEKECEYMISKKSTDDENILPFPPGNSVTRNSNEITKVNNLPYIKINYSPKRTIKQIQPKMYNSDFFKERLLKKENIYQNLIREWKVFEENSSFFNLSQGNNKNFYCLGLEDRQLQPDEENIKKAMNQVSRYIFIEVEDEYVIRDEEMFFLHSV